MDQGLVERAQRGDREAYERLARASADRLYAVAYQITRDADAADNAVQQAYWARNGDPRQAVSPDTPMSLSSEDFFAGRDPALEAALEGLTAP